MLDAAKRLLSAFSIGRVLFCLIVLFFFFLINIPQTVLVPVSI